VSLLVWERGFRDRLQSEVMMKSAVRRGPAVHVVAVTAVAAALMTGFELLPSGDVVLWIAVVAITFVAVAVGYVLARRGKVDSAAVLLLSAFVLALFIGPLATGDLGIAPFWLGPIAAAGLLVLSRRYFPALIVGLALALVGLLLVGRPSGFITPDYLALLVGGALVSLATVVVAAYGVHERTSSLQQAQSLTLQADDLLTSHQQVRADLMARAVVCEASVAAVVSERERLIESLSEMAVRDPSTGLFNARHHKEQWAMVIEESKVTGLPVSVIALDLDNFGRVNREYSHETGDRVLEEFATLIRRHIRPGDIPYRLGQGEEFIVLLPHTRSHEAVAVAERIRVGTRKHGWNDMRPEDRLTLSAGVSDRSAQSSERWSDVLKRADAALLQSKADGRDRVTESNEVAL